MDTLVAILVSIITSSTIVGILVFLVRKYLGDLISYEFKKRAEQDAELRARESKRNELFFQNRMGIYPEIAEVTYRIKKLLESVLDAAHAYDCNDELPLLTGHLTEFLYKYRFFLPDTLFYKLHDLKRVAQDTVLFIDVHTREECLFDSEAFRMRQDNLRKKAEKAGNLYADIIKELNKFGELKDD